MQSEVAGRVIRIEEVPVAAPPATIAEARALLLSYGQFIVSHENVAGFCFGTLEKEAASLPLSYIERNGGCLLARADDAAVGLVAWREIAPHTWEMKRLWVAPEARGLGLGHALTQAVLNRAIAAGCKAVYLDTVPAAMASAYRLYRTMGFTPCPPYNDNPVKGIEYLVKWL